MATFYAIFMCLECGETYLVEGWEERGQGELVGAVPERCQCGGALFDTGESERAPRRTL